MASGRNEVDYTDIRRDALTYKIDNSTIVFDGTKARGAADTMLDKAVTYSANDTVALAADGDHVVGKLQQVFADNFCTVVDFGFVTLPAGASATVTRGKKFVGALGAASAKGYIRDVVVAAGTYAASEANEMEKARGRIVNTADTTAVVVEL